MREPEGGGARDSLAGGPGRNRQYNGASEIVTRMLDCGNQSSPPRSWRWPLARWACTCYSSGECATCLAWVTPGAAGAQRMRADRYAATRRQPQRDGYAELQAAIESSEGFAELVGVSK